MSSLSRNPISFSLTPPQRLDFWRFGLLKVFCLFKEFFKLCIPLKNNLWSGNSLLSVDIGSKPRVDRNKWYWTFFPERCIETFYFSKQRFLWQSLPTLCLCWPADKVKLCDHWRIFHFWRFMLLCWKNKKQ